MNKNNKKWSIITSLILVSVLASSIGIGAIIGVTTKDDSYIKFYVEGEEYITDELTMGDIGASDEEKALIIQAQFLTYAIFGTTDINDVLNPENNSHNLLSEDQTWNTSYQVERKDSTDDIEKTILDTFVKMKFFNDTQYSSVIDYLYKRIETATNPQTLLLLIEQIISYSLNIPEENPEGKEPQDPMQITGTDVINAINADNSTGSNDDVVNFGKNLFKALIDDYSYQVEILMDIYTYIYLWQEPVESNTYDYMLTKELAYAKPSITWSMTYDAEKFDANKDENVTKFMDAIMEDYSHVSSYIDLSDSSVEGSTGNAGWNSVYEVMYANGYLTDPSTYENILLIDKTNKYSGFQGVTFGTSAGSGIDSSWNDSENIWSYKELDKDGVEDSITQNNSVSDTNRKDIMMAVNIYVPEDNDKGGIVSGVIDDPENPIFTPPSGEESIYLYNQLTPYIFKTSTMNDGTAEFGTAKFSLFANVLNDIYTPYTDENKESEGVVYLFDEWFGESSLMGEIYIVEALLLHNSTLEASATNYWQEEGFYIELSGKYEEDLIGFIPADMIKE